jgi:hypothetical protein
VAPAKIVKPIPERDPRPMTTVNVAGLNWQARDIRRLNWYSAMTHCKNLGMRLPSKEQLQSALSTGSKSLNSPCCEYWTSTTHEEDADNAYNISTKSIENFFSSKSNVFYVRCVSK